MGMRRFTRLTNAFKKFESHVEMAALYRLGTISSASMRRASWRPPWRPALPIGHLEKPLADEGWT
jgi:hypothetical protein